MDSFIRKQNSIVRQYRKPMAFLGVTSLAMGLGVFQAVSATASNTAAGCSEENTVEPGLTPNDSRNAVQALVDVEAPLICLDGTFDLSSDSWIEFSSGVSAVHFYGVGQTVLTAVDQPVFYSDMSDSTSITIENISITGSGSSTWPAVVSQNVTVIDSNFSDNSLEGVILSYGTATVSNSTFVDNTAADFAGAISASEVIVTNSTFSGNSTSYYGGAIYSDIVEVTNSTFFNNSAIEVGGEGGAIFATEGSVYFSTFLNNLASTPSDDPNADTPGNAIYKTSGELNVGGNIFAGESLYPQLGYGEDITHFTDLGGNVFSTSAVVESDIARDPLGDLEQKHPTSVFGASLTEIFGTASPTLGTFAPNSSGTQTIGLVAGSPALNIVPNEAPFTSVTTDQRGATRSHPADAGAFEGVVEPTPTPTPTSAPTSQGALAKTGNESPLWMTIASAALVSVGGLALGLRSRLRRRISQ